MTTMVYYYVPEDDDDPEQPNGFIVKQSSDNIRVSHIRKSFPMNGQYYFRFKFEFNKNTVFMDLNSEDCKVPLYKGKIFMQVSRLSWNQKEVQVDKEIVRVQKPYFQSQTSNSTQSFQNFQTNVQNKNINDLIDF